MDFLLKHLFFRQDCSQYTWTFQKACAHNRPTLLCSLAHREDIKNYKTDRMYRLLLNACKNNYVEVVKFLISRDVKMHTYRLRGPDDKYAGLFAVSSSHEIIPEVERSVLTYCAEIGNLTIMRLFENIDFVKNISKYYGDKQRCIYYDAIKLACYRKNAEIVQYLIEQYKIELDTSTSIFWDFVDTSVLTPYITEEKRFKKCDKQEAFHYLIDHCDTSNGILGYAENIINTTRKYCMTPKQVIKIDKLLNMQNMQDMQDLQEMQYMQDLQEMQYMQNMQNMRKKLKRL